MGAGRAKVFQSGENQEDPLFDLVVQLRRAGKRNQPPRDGLADVPVLVFWLAMISEKAEKKDELMIVTARTSSCAG
jgi:hypothetical protein